MRPGIHPEHFLRDVVNPGVEFMVDCGITSTRRAKRLLFFTAAVESLMGRYLRQVGGPALGPFQMEPATYRGLWLGYLAHPHRAHWRSGLRMLGGNLPTSGERPDESMLATNLTFAAAMTRVYYWHIPTALPDGDLPSLARYWKQHYNTPLGKGVVEEAVIKAEPFFAEVGNDNPLWEPAPLPILPPGD